MSDNPYNGPKADVEVQSTVHKSTRGEFFVAVGAIALLALPIGLISTIFEMFKVFELIPLSGSGDPKVMAGAISQALISTFLGFLLSTCGALFLFFTISFSGYRRPWVYRICKVYALLSLLVFPVGTVIGIVTLLVLRKNKARYFN